MPTRPTELMTMVEVACESELSSPTRKLPFVRGAPSKEVNPVPVIVKALPMTYEPAPQDAEPVQVMVEVAVEPNKDG